MKISAVVFDFDGTLVDSNAIKRQGFFDVVAGDAGGVETMREVLARTPGDRHAVMAAYAAAQARSGSESSGVEALVRRYNEHVDATVARAPEITGASHLLKSLRNAGVRVYLSSATPLVSLERIIERRGWTHLFDGVFGRPSDKHETLDRVRRTAGLDPDRIAVIGDGLDDRESAQAAGCRFYAVGEARGTPAADQVFALCELQDLLLGADPPSKRT